MIRTAQSAFGALNLYTGAVGIAGGIAFLWFVSIFPDGLKSDGLITCIFISAHVARVLAGILFVQKGSSSHRLLGLLVLTAILDAMVLWPWLFNYYPAMNGSNYVYVFAFIIVSSSILQFFVGLQIGFVAALALSGIERIERVTAPSPIIDSSVREL